MGNFKQDYERDFGPLQYEPLDPKPFIEETKRRALNIERRVPSSSPRMAIDLGYGEPVVKDQGATTGLLKTGTAMLGEAVLGAVEYGLDKSSSPTLQSAADAVQSTRESLAAWRESVYARMDDEVIDMKGREFLTLDPDKTIWKGSPIDVGKSIMYKLVEQVPMTLATLVPGGLMMRAGSKGAISYLGASEAGLSVGFIQNEIKDGIKEMTDQELMAESPRFNQLFNELGSAEARNRFEAEATGMAPLIGGLVVGAIGAAAGRYLEPVLIPDGAGLGLRQRVARGAISEGLLQEAPQEGTEQIASNAARAAYDGNVGLLDGVAEAMVQGAVIGGSMGGGFAALAGRGPTPPTPSDEDLDTSLIERDTPDDEGGGGVATAWDVTLPETDLFGGKVVAVDSSDPNQERRQALRLDEEYEAIGALSYQERQIDEANDLQAQQLQKKAKSKRTKAENKWLLDYRARQEAREKLRVSYGGDPAVSAAIAATVGRLGAISGGQQDMFAQYDQQRYGEMRQEGQLGVDVANAAQQVRPAPPQPTASVEMPGGQMTLPGMDMTDARLPEQTYRTRGSVADQVAPEEVQVQGEPTRAYSPERFEEGAILPDQMDRPTEEPLRDIQAQLAAMDRGERDGVYITAETLKRNPDLLNREQGATIRNFDGKGGAVVFKDKKTADKWRTKRPPSGESLQKILGAITGAGEGKPVSPTSVTLQQLDDDGNVERESLVASQEEAEALQEKWQKKAGTTARVTPLLSKLSGMSREDVEAQYGAQAEEFNWVEKIAPDGKVVERRLVLGEEATAEIEAQYEQQAEGKFRILTPEQTLARRKSGVQEEMRFERDPAYEAQFQQRQYQLFESQPEIISQTRNLKVSRVGPRVRVMDGNVVLWEKVFRAGFTKDADNAVAQLQKEIEEIKNIVISGERRFEGVSVWQDKAKPRPEWQGPRGPRVATRAEARAAYSRVQDRELEEEVGPKIAEAGVTGRDLGEAVEGAETTSEVVSRLLEKGAVAEKESRAKRIAGIQNPNELTFVDRQAESAYREAWSLAVEAQLRKELKVKLQGEQRRQVISAADKDLVKAQKMVAALRKRGEQARFSSKPNKYWAAARKVDKQEVRRQTEAQRQAAERKVRGKAAEAAEQTAEILKATQTTQAQYEVDIREEAYGSTEYDVMAVEAAIKAEEAAVTPTEQVDELGEFVREPVEAEPVAPEQVDIAPQKWSLEQEEETGVAEFNPLYTYKHVMALYNVGELTLNELIDLAVEGTQYRASFRTLSQTAAAEQIREIREGYKLTKTGKVRMYPSDYARIVNQAANVAANQAAKEGRSRKHFIVLPRLAGNKLSTTTISGEGLTAASYQYEEPEKRTARIKATNEARGRLEQNIPKLEKKLAELKVERETIPNPDTGADMLNLPTEVGVDQLLALDYLNQLLRAAKIVAGMQRSDQTITTMLKAFDEAVAVASNIKQAELRGWSLIAIKQSQQSITPSKRGSEEGLESVAKLDGENIKQTFKKRKDAEKHRLQVQRKDSTLYGQVRPTKDGQFQVTFMRQKTLTAKKNAARYYENLKTWRESSDFNTFVWPLIQRMTQAKYYQEGVYNPTIAEAETLDWLLHSWSKNPEPGFGKKFVDPLKDLLRNVGGLKFNEDGRLEIEDRGDGRILIEEWNVFSGQPPASLLESGIIAGVRSGTPLSTARLAEPTRNIAPSTEPKRPTHDLFGNRIPWNKVLPYQKQEEQLAEEEPVAAPKGQKKLFSKANVKAVEPAIAPTNIKLLQVFRKFRKVIDHSKSTKAALIDAEEKLLRSLEALGVKMTYANFAGLVRIALPDGKVVTYRRAASDLANGNISKQQARGRMKAITKKLGQGTAAERAWLDQRGEEGQWNNLPMFDESYTYAYELENFFDTVTGLDRDAAREVTAALGDQLLGNRQADIATVIETIQEKASGAAKEVAGKLQQAAAGKPKIRWVSRKTKNLGRFDPDTNTIELNENALINLRGLDMLLDAKVVHAVMHETAHAGSLHGLRTDPQLRQAMETLRQLMAQKWTATAYIERMPESNAQEYASFAYGLKNVEEFVAEMFSNPQMIELAKETYVGEMGRLLPESPDFKAKVRMTAWRRFKNLLADFFGIESREEMTVFDTVMEMSDVLFAGAGKPVGGGAVHLDMPLQKIAAQGWGRLKDAAGLEGRVFNRGDKGARVDQVTSMSQLRKRFGGRLPGLANYVSAFNERNARNAELMQRPEKISRDWTSLEESQPEQAVNLSRVMSLSSLYGVDPSLTMGDKRNSIVKSVAAQRRFRELQKDFQSLSPEAKRMWEQTREYYKTALEQETALMLLNALRGVVKMDAAMFDNKYNAANILKYRTKAALEAEFGKALDDLDLNTIAELADIPELTSGVYFPLTRYGDYAVNAETVVADKLFAEKSQADKFAKAYKEQDPTYQISSVYDEEFKKWSVKVVDREFHLFETATQAREEKARLEKLYDEVVLSLKQDTTPAEAAIGSNAALKSILDQLHSNPAAQAAIKNFYLRNLSSSSFRKRQINRKRVKGVDLAQQHRNFANYAKQASYYTAQLEHGWRMSDAMKEMRQFLRQYKGEDSLRLGHVLRSIEERDNLSQDLVQVGDTTRKLLGATQFWMLTSASYHMINASQPWMVTAPVLRARHGAKDTFQAMKLAQSKIFKTLGGEAWASKFGLKALTSRAAAEKAFGVFHQLTENIRASGDPRAEEYIAMLDELRKHHILEISPMTELREIAAGKTSAASKILDASRIMSHIVEVNNRVLTALAAYDLELAKTGSKEAAVEYAKDIVETTQFNYSSQNKPPLFQKYPLLFQFMQWTQHMYALLLTNYKGMVDAGVLTNSEARRTLLGVIGTHAMVTGAVGVTLQPIKMALGAVALLFSDDDDPINAADVVSGEWFDREVTAAFAEVFGSDLAMIMSRGLPMALGTDLSTRMSMGTLYFVDLKTDSPESVAGSLLMSFGGAPLSQLMQWTGGLGKIADGEWERGIEQMAPKLFRDMLRAGRYANEGLVNRAGDTVIPSKDISPWQLALQYMGFAPEQVSRFYAGQQAMKTVETFVRQRKAELLKQFRTAKTANERMEARKAIREFNKKYRYDPIRASSLRSTVKSKIQRERSYQRYGAAIDANKARQYKGFGEPYR